MPEKEFNLWLEQGFLCAWRGIRDGKVIDFRVVYLAEIGNKFQCITRYDTAHGYAHRDVLGRKEGLRGKIPCPTMNHNQAFNYAIRDIKTNAPIYLADFLAH
jgi:hypothetical protein